MNNKYWYAAEIHCHTLHSDGDFTVPELIATAKKRMLDGICLTDHNTVSGHDEAFDDSLAILKGIEWTTYFGHMKVLGTREFVDWRDALIDTIDEKMLEVKNAGGLVGIAHPFQLGTPICTGGHWDYNIKDYSLVNYLEIWSEGCPYLNSANKKAIELWRSLLDKGYRITPTFGRDWHRSTNNEYHSACTYILSEDEAISADTIKNAIKGGKTVVSVGPLFCFETKDGFSIGDTVPEGEHTICFNVDMQRMDKMLLDYKVQPKEIRLIGKEYKTVLSLKGEEKQCSVYLSKGEAYHAELWGDIDGKENCQLCVTAAIYVKGEN